MATLAEQLAEAEAAYHNLMTGSAVVRFQDQNGESLTYTQATVGRLSAYIAGLRRQIGGKRPVLTINFRTSKGV